MAKVIHRQLFVPMPLLRAIEHLPEAVEVDGIRLELTGRTERAPIVAGLWAYRAHAGCASGAGWIDLTSVATARTEMTLVLSGVPAALVEQLLLVLRVELVRRANPPAASATDARMDVCRTA